MKIQTTSFSLKLLAFIAMTLDHVGYFMVYSDPTLYYVFRIIGRLAMPIFCFCIAEGYENTKSRQKYLLRLIVAALISEIPFNLCFDGKLISHGYMNVMFTLSIALVSLMLSEMIAGTKFSGLFFIPFIAAFFAAELLSTDYGGYGVLLVIFFCLAARSRHVNIARTAVSLCFAARTVIIYVIKYLLSLTGIIAIPSLTSWDALQLFAFFAIVPILLYRGKWGPRFRSEAVARIVRYSMYLFYPIHMLIIWAAFKFF